LYLRQRLGSNIGKLTYKFAKCLIPKNKTDTEMENLQIVLIRLIGLYAKGELIVHQSIRTMKNFVEDNLKDGIFKKSGFFKKYFLKFECKVKN
jgi:hypothetical protein